MKIDPKKLLKFCLIATATFKLLLFTKTALMGENMFFETIIFPFSILLLYCGIKSDYFLQKLPKILLNFVIFYLSLEIFIVLALRGVHFFEEFISLGQYLVILGYIIGIVLLGRYLIHTIKKLSTQNTIIEYKGYRKIIIIFVLLTILYLFLYNLESACSIGYVGGYVGGTEPLGGQWDGVMCVPFWEKLQ